MITLLNKFDDNYVIEKKDIYDIVTSYIKENNLEAYVSDINFDPNNKYIAHYNTVTNELVFNDTRIIIKAYDLYDYLFNKFAIDENYYTYFINFYYLYVIYHELTHASQKAKFESNLTKEDDIFNFLYILCEELRKEDLDFYRRKHCLFPMEIDANNNGYLRAYNLMNYTKLPSYECKIMQWKYLQTLISHYKLMDNSDTVISPVETLIKDNPEHLKKISELLELNKLSKMEKINLGLGITSKEYNSIVNEKNKVFTKIK